MIQNPLNDPALFDVKPNEDYLLKEFRFKIFKRIFKISICKETHEKKSILSPVEPCMSSEQSAFACGLPSCFVCGHMFSSPLEKGMCGPCSHKNWMSHDEPESN